MKCPLQSHVLRLGPQLGVLLQEVGTSWRNWVTRGVPLKVILVLYSFSLYCVFVMIFCFTIGPESMEPRIMD
jgi:hypothetical protein